MGYKQDLKVGKIHRGNFESNKDFLMKNKSLLKGKKILEIGCGAGELTRWLMGKGYNVLGIDLSEDLIKYAKKKGPSKIFSVMDAQDLKFKDNSFDVVLSFDLFEHLPFLDKHQKEVKKVLKNRGYYLLQTPNKVTNIPFEIIKERSFTKYKTYHCSLHTYWQLKRRFEKNGFDIKFFKINVVNKFFKEKVKRQFGNFGVSMLKFINLNKLPLPLRTNFYVVARLR